MATPTLIDIQREGDQTVERYSIAVARGVETAAFDLTPQRISRTTAVVGPVQATVLSADSKTVRLFDYPIIPASNIDAHSLVGTQNDLVYSDASQGGTASYTGTEPSVFQITITSAAASPDQFKWNRNGGTFTTGVNCSTSEITLTAGVKIKFGAVDGHTLDDTWYLTVFPSTGTFQISVKGYGG